VQAVPAALALLLVLARGELAAVSAPGTPAVRAVAGLAQTVVRQGEHGAPAQPRHRARGHERVDDRLLRRSHRGFEERVHAVVGQHGQRGHAFAVTGVRVGGREGEEEVARSVAGDRARAREAERGPAGEALELMRQERRVRGHHDEDGAHLVPGSGAFADLLSDRDARHQELMAAAVVRLHERAHRVAALRARTREAVPMPPLKP
jgi:hypothetical protein